MIPEKKILVEAVGNGVSFQTDQGIMLQLGKRKNLTGKSGKGPSADQKLAKREKRNASKRSLGFRRGRDHGKIDLAVPYCCKRGSCRVVGNANPDMRILQVEIFQNIQKIAVERSFTGTDGDTAGG